MKSTTKKLAGQVARNPIKSFFLFLVAAFLLGGAGLLVIKHRETQVDKLPLLGKRIYVDVENLRHGKFLPSQIDNLQTIKIAVHTKDDTLKRALLKNILFPLKAKRDGHFSLQVDVIENFDDDPQVILQFNLYENLSKNKIWEFARLYQLSPAELEEIKKLAATIPPSMAPQPPAPDAPDGPEQSAGSPKKPSKPIKSTVKK